MVKSPTLFSLSSKMSTLDTVIWDRWPVSDGTAKIFILGRPKKIVAPKKQKNRRICHTNNLYRLIITTFFIIHTHVTASAVYALVLPIIITLSTAASATTAPRSGKETSQSRHRRVVSVHRHPRHSIDDDARLIARRDGVLVVCGEDGVKFRLAINIQKHHSRHNLPKTPSYTSTLPVVPHPPSFAVLAGADNAQSLAGRKNNYKCL